jgi:predicted dinucleotide-binding enzyme
MKIAIIGAGNVGKTLGDALAGKKHDVSYIRKEMPADERAGVIGSADVVILATQWGAARSALEGLPLSGKILIDLTNPLKADLSGLEFGGDTSAAEQVAASAPGASVVKAFNTVGFAVMANPQFGDRRAMMMIASDDADAKRAATTLAGDLGFEPVDAGPLTAARLLESLAMLWIALAIRGGMGSDFAFGVLRR